MSGREGKAKHKKKRERMVCSGLIAATAQKILRIRGGRQHDGERGGCCES
jgi:hypothetical protein